MNQTPHAHMETVHVITDEIFPAYELGTPDQGQPLQVDEQTADRWRTAIATYADTCQEITTVLTAQDATTRRAA